jgi:integrase
VLPRIFEEVVVKLTKAAVAELTTDKDDETFWDGDLPGFGIRLRRSERTGRIKKTFRIQYRVGLQQRSESLDPRKVSLEDGRRIARQRFAQAELGVDPAADKGKARALATKAALTLGAVSERYLASKRDIIRSSTHREATRYFTVQWASLRDRPISGVARADVAAQLQIIIKTHGRTSAGRARANLSAMYAWAIGEALVDSNPVIGTNNPGDGIKSRARVLSDVELNAVWQAAGDSDFGRIVKLLILTGARRQEIGSIRWSDVDFNTGALIIPADRAKNGHALELPLPAAALGILQDTPRRGDYIFGAAGTGFTSWSIATTAMRRRITKPMAPWTLHDLRRSMRTGLGRIGVPPHVAELLINHLKGGVEAVYDKYSYDGEKRAALARWADHVLAVTEGRESNVVSLRGA